VAAACAQGQTVLRGAEELRVKESDRIQVMADGLHTLGIDSQPTSDGIVISGCDAEREAVFGGGTINSHHDHRIAMSFAIAALRASAPLRIEDCDNVATSFPNFVELAQLVGMHIEVQR
jgi:3-phosphoshikimate 1-carboxyvinyltransferase